MPGFTNRPDTLQRQRGLVSVEFAIVAALLVYFLFGILQFGWLLHNYIMIESAVGSGVRFFSAQIGETSVKTETLSVINNALPATLQFTLGQLTTSVQGVACDDSDCGTALANAPGGAASLSLSYTVQPIFGVRLWGLDTLWPTSHNFAVTASIKSTS